MDLSGDGIIDLTVCGICGEDDDVRIYRGTIFIIARCSGCVLRYQVCDEMGRELRMRAISVEMFAAPLRLSPPPAIPA